MDKNKKGRPGQEKGQVRARDLRLVPLGEIEKGVSSGGQSDKTRGTSFYPADPQHGVSGFHPTESPDSAPSLQPPSQLPPGTVTG